MTSTDETLIAALRILAGEIQSYDGVANAVIADAANRLAELTGTQATGTESRHEAQ